MKKLNVRIPENLRAWIEARDQHRLSHAHVQMARELGLNPRNLGKMTSNPDEPWKIPLPQFLEQLYLKRFEKAEPDKVLSIEEYAREAAAKKAARKAANAVDPERQARRKAAQAALRESRAARTSRPRASAVVEGASGEDLPAEESGVETPATAEPSANPDTN